MQPRLDAPSARPRCLAWGVAASLLVHAALIAALGWQARPHRAAAVPPGRSITWLTARLMPAGAPAAEAAPRERTPPPAPRPRRIRRAAVAGPNAVPARTATARPAEAAPPPSVDAPHPVAGVAFAPPRIGFGGTGPARWMPPPSPTDAAAPPPQRVMPPPQMLAQAARQAGLQQIALALQQQLGALPQPEGVSGRCSLPEQATDQGALACDSDTLQQALGGHLATLAGLLKAWRGLSPQPGAAAIAYAQGRYQLDLN